MHSLHLRESLAPAALVEPASAPDEQYVAWSDLAGFVRRQWPILLAMVILGGAGALFYAAHATRTWEGDAVILIDKDQYNLPEMVTHHATDEGDLSTEIEVLRTAPLSRQVVHDLALNVSLGDHHLARSAIVAGLADSDSMASGTVTLDRKPDGYFAAHDDVTGQQVEAVAVGVPAVVGGLHFILQSAARTHAHLTLVRESEGAATLALQHALNVGRGERNANVIWVRYRSTDPELARAVPADLADRYLADRVTTAREKVSTAVSYLTDEADTLQRQLVAADDALQAFRQRAGVVSLPDEAASTVSQTGQLRGDRTRIEAERTALQQLMRQADTSASAYRRLAAFPTLIGNPIIANLLHTVSDLEGQRTEMLLRRTPQDPDVKAIDEQLQNADQQLRGLTQTYLAGLGRQVTALDQALAGQAAIAATLPGKSTQEDELSRRPKVLNDVYSVVETRLQEARIAESVVNPGVSIIERPVTPTAPVWPRRGLLTAVGVIAGLLGGAAIAWAREGLDPAIHSRADVTRAVELPVLSAVPHIHQSSEREERDGAVLLLRGARRPALLPMQRSRSARGDDATALGTILEAYTWLETSLAFATAADEMHTIAFTSALAREGKTVTAANFAISAARHGRRVLLIDADLRRGRVHQVFDVPPTPGFADVLAGEATIGNAVLSVPVGGEATMDLLPRGTHPHHPTSLLATVPIRRLLADLRQRYDLILFDSPPVNLVSDALLVGAAVDGVVMVARAGVTDAAALSEAARRLREARAPVLGVLLNDIHLQRDGSYDESYRYLRQAGMYATANDG
ncbi:MAG TPA: polysaccharide biosynthesis tyrosine autokinase [Gemmatimonadales bacterium]|nr:polysaccharide biosynthesis tyrosine autokinase [Gemmatimonadales bacterium]